MIKLCFSTLGCVERSLDSILELAREYSASGIELRGMSGEIDTLKCEQFQHNERKNTRRMLSELGIAPVVLGTSVSFHDSEKLPSLMEEGRRSIDASSEMGIPFIRVFGNIITEDREACYSRVIGGLSQLCEYARGKGVTVLLEVHGDYSSIETLSPILKALANTPEFGLIWDVYHSHKVYGENWEPFYEFIKPYVKHVHIKDFSDARGALCLPGEGDIPLASIMHRLLLDGYDGFFSLEWERFWHPELEDISVALRKAREIIGGL